MLWYFVFLISVEEETKDSDEERDHDFSASTTNFPSDNQAKYY